MGEEQQPNEEAKPVDRLEETKKVVEALRAEKEAALKVLEESKRFAANKLLEGETYAGTAQVQPAPMTAKEYANAVMSGKIPKK